MLSNSIYINQYDGLVRGANRIWFILSLLKWELQVIHVVGFERRERVLKDWETWTEFPGGNDDWFLPSKASGKLESRRWQSRLARGTEWAKPQMTISEGPLTPGSSVLMSPSSSSKFVVVVVFNVNHFKNLCWICCNVASVLYFGFLAGRHVVSHLPDQGSNLYPLQWKAKSRSPDPQGSPDGSFLS